MEYWIKKGEEIIRVILIPIKRIIPLFQYSKIPIVRSELSPKTKRFGLFRIRERLNYLGGQLKVESEPSSGTMVSLVVPLK
jgi:sensor histidine kinase YesM